MTHSQKAADHIEWYSEVPRGIRKHTFYGLLLILAAFGGFGAWAFTAPLAAAVISQGSFVATGQNKIIQHLEGGVIHEILVTEGDTVEKGQPIVRLDDTAALADERQLFLRRARLEAINARLVSHFQGLSEVAFPDFLTRQASNEEIASMLESQRINFQASRGKLDNDLKVYESNIASLEFRTDGFELQRSSMERQLELLESEGFHTQGGGQRHTARHRGCGGPDRPPRFPGVRNTGADRQTETADGADPDEPSAGRGR